MTTIQKDVAVGILAPFPFIGLVAMITGKKKETEKEVGDSDCTVELKAAPADDETTEAGAVVGSAYALQEYAKLAFAFLPLSFVFLEHIERKSCWHARVVTTQLLAVATTTVAVSKGTYDFSLPQWTGYHVAKGAMYFAVLDWGCRALRRKLD